MALPLLSIRSFAHAGARFGPLALATLTLVACSDPPPDQGSPGAPTADAKPGNIFEIVSGADIAGPGDAAGEDAPGPAEDVTVAVASDAEPGEDAAVPGDAESETAVMPGTFGAPCDGPDDCDTGLCVPSPQGSICTRTCDGDCPDAFKCVAKTSPGGDVSWLCVPAFTTLCDPCDSNADCNEQGEMLNVCVSFGADGAFCGTACGAGKQVCPAGYACDAVTDASSGKQSQQCVFQGGLCPCSAKAAALGLDTTCVNKNLAGKCTGVRVCSSGGLSACQAPVPKPEECNDIDDDCNGKTDDFTGSAKCENKNQFGVCPGVVVDCKDGKAVCAGPEPKLETCNGLDDDCNGTTDDVADKCDDANPCTKDTCSIDGTCKHAPQSGEACDDGNSCTSLDKCSQGACTGGKPLGCDDGDPCTLDGCDALGGCVQTPTDGKCEDDGSPCTLDLCKDGKCSHPPQSEGGACTDDGNACTQDVCKTGTCAHPPVADGIACLEDGDPCTQDVCSAGKCSHLAEKDGISCLDDGKPCTQDVCAAGKCSHPPVAFTVACEEDGNACTADVCDKGACTHQQLGSEKSCLEDGDPCTQDVCLKGACSHPPALNNTPCADDGVACTDDLCINGLCKHPNLDGKPCVDDGVLCTQDVCSGGKCSHPAKDNIPCDDDGNACTSDSCKGGKCSHVYNNSGCNDNDPCTLTDYCNLGVCKGMNAPVCDDGNPCTSNKCQIGQGCVYTPQSSIMCNDNNVCTTTDVCNGGVCKGTGGKDCDDGNACTNDNCDTGGGCTHVANAQPCPDDGNPCTSDLCANKACTHPAKASGAPCDNGSANPCADGVCQSGVCKSQNNDKVCNDSNACTSNDKCVAGVCQGTAFKDCNDGNPCTQDSCDKNGQCTHAGQSGTACSAPSGDCPIGVCQGGQCLSKPGVTCQAEYDVDLCASVEVPGTCSGSGKCVASSAPPGYTCPGCNGICIKCLIFQFCLAL